MFTFHLISFRKTNNRAAQLRRLELNSRRFREKQALISRVRRFTQHKVFYLREPGGTERRDGR